METKTCRKCGEAKPLTEFYSYKGGCVSRCKPCIKTSVRQWRSRNNEKVKVRKREIWRELDYSKNFAARLLRSARRRSKLPFELDEKWVNDRLTIGHCLVTGISFEYKRGGPFLPSLDQIRAGEGYTKANSQIVVWIYNAAKNNWGHFAVLKLAKSLIS